MSWYFDEEEAAEKLRELGYRVIKVEFSPAASNIKDLIEYFYARRLYYNPDRPFPPSRNFVEDRNYLSGFVKKRQALGLSKKNAVREAAMLALRESKEAKQVKKKHFVESLKKIRPSVSKPTLEVYKKIEDNFLRSAKAAVPLESSYLG